MVVVEVGRVIMIVLEPGVVMRVGVLAEHRWVVGVIVMAVVVAVDVIVVEGGVNVAMGVALADVEVDARGEQRDREHGPWTCGAIAERPCQCGADERCEREYRAGAACTDAALRSFGLTQHFLGHAYSEQIDNTMTSDSYAAFGDVIWHINDRLNLTGGPRFTRDDKDFGWFNQPRSAEELDENIAQLAAMGLLSAVPPQLVYVLTHNIVFPDAVGIPVSRNGSWRDVSPRVVLDYQFTPDTMGFVSVSKGYKAGGNDGVQIDSEYDPEEVWNYELGFKNAFPTLNMVLNASIYHYDYSDRQSLALVPATTPGGIPQYLVQSTDQSADGLDVEWLWKPMRNLTLNLSAAYIDSQFDDSAQTASGIDLSGQPTGEPEWSFAAGATYGWELANNGSMEFNLQYAYRGEARCSVEQQRAAAEATERLAAADAGDADDHRGSDQRHDQHLQRVQEQRTDEVEHRVERDAEKR